MSGRSSARHGEAAALAWKKMVAVVMDSRDEWRRQVASVTDMPFSRWRALRRLDGQSRTLRDLAEAMAADAPAATLAVDDLEERGLVVRQPHPDDRRAKLVSITAAGRRMLTRANQVADEPPAALRDLSGEELEAFLRVMQALRPD